MKKVIYKIIVKIEKTEKGFEIKEDYTEHEICFENDKLIITLEDHIRKDNMYRIIHNYKQNPILPDGVKIIIFSKDLDFENAKMLISHSIFEQIDFYEQCSKILLNSI